MLTKQWTYLTSAIAVLVAATAGANDFSIDWHTVDGGGGYSAGGDFEVEGAIGQPDAGVLTGGDFELVGGFWGGAQAVTPSCPGDADGDNDVDLTDLAILLSNFGTVGGVDPSDGDIDDDDDVDLTDLALLLAAFGTFCG
jgi:hypothetical protein